MLNIILNTVQKGVCYYKWFPNFCIKLYDLYIIIYISSLCLLSIFIPLTLTHR